MPSIKRRLAQVVKTTPLNFQLFGVKHIERCQGRALVADEMGLGKTYQVLAWLALHPEALPAIVVCPATLKFAWEREAWRHVGILGHVIEGRVPNTRLRGDLWIINYDIVEKWGPALLHMKPKTLIVDECQRLINPRAKRTIACNELAKRCEHVVGMSGTPIHNRPVEFFPILHMIAPKEFTSFYKYAFRYCKPRRGYGGRWTFDGASHVEELHERVSRLMIRRRMREVMDDMPEKVRTIIPVKINMTEYRRACDEFSSWISEMKGSAAAKRAKKCEALTKLGYLKRLAAEAKLPMVKRWIREYLEDLRKRKLVVFAIQHKIVDALLDEFPGAAVVTGSVSKRDRVRAVDRFQNDPKCRLFIGNLAAAGVGLTLTASYCTAAVEIDWVPAQHEQAEHRVLRIGQNAKRVDAVYFVAKDTVEEDIMDIIESKRDVIGAVVDGGAVENVQTIILQKYLKGRQ